MVELGQKLDSVASLHLHCVGLLGDGGLSILAERLRGLDEISTGVLLAKRSSAIKKPTLITSSPSWTQFTDSKIGTLMWNAYLSSVKDLGFFAKPVMPKSRKNKEK